MGVGESRIMRIPSLGVEIEAKSEKVTLYEPREGREKKDFGATEAKKSRVGVLVDHLFYYRSPFFSLSRVATTQTSGRIVCQRPKDYWKYKEIVVSIISK